MVDCAEVHRLSWCWSSFGEGSVFLLAFTLVDWKLSVNLAKAISNAHPVMSG